MFISVSYQKNKKNKKTKQRNLHFYRTSFKQHVDWKYDIIKCFFLLHNGGFKAEYSQWHWRLCGDNLISIDLFSNQCFPWTPTNLCIIEACSFHRWQVLAFDPGGNNVPVQAWVNERNDADDDSQAGGLPSSASFYCNITGDVKSFYFLEIIAFHLDIIKFIQKTNKQTNIPLRHFSNIVFCNLIKNLFHWLKARHFPRTEVLIKIIY